MLPKRRILLLRPASKVFKSALAGASMDNHFKYAKYMDEELSKNLYAIVSSVNGIDYIIENVVQQDEALERVTERIAETAKYDSLVDAEGIDAVNVVQMICDRRIDKNKKLGHDDRVCDLSFSCLKNDSHTVISYECD